MRRLWHTAPLAAVAVGITAYLSWGTAWAQAGKQTAPAGVKGGTGRLAAIDVVLIFNEYQRQKDLTEEMKKLRQQLDDENRQRLQKIDARQKELDMTDAATNDPAYIKKMREVLAMQIEYKNWFDLKQAELGREVAVWTAKVYKEISDAVEQIAQREGFDLVLYRQEFPQVSVDPEEIRNRIRSRIVIYASAANDVTQPVLDKLNADYRAAPPAPMLNIP